jgi:glycosyltransferase involved in cell wall biosynthesis
LDECIRSVQAQSFREFEVIFVDGGSTDDTLTIASACSKGRIISQTRPGLAAAWNEGILASQGTYIAFLDSDDWWESNCLSHHMYGLCDAPNYDYSIGQVKYFTENADALPRGFKPSLLLGSHRALMPGCFVGKRSLFDRIGFFDESLRVATDIQWFHDLKLTGASFHELNEHVLNKRVHDSNLSYTLAETPTYGRELLRVLRRRIHKAQGNGS